MSRSLSSKLMQSSFKPDFKFHSRFYIYWFLSKSTIYHCCIIFMFMIWRKKLYDIYFLRYCNHIFDQLEPKIWKILQTNFKLFTATAGTFYISHICVYKKSSSCSFRHLIVIVTHEAFPFARKNPDDSGCERADGNPTSHFIRIFSSIHKQGATAKWSSASKLK